MSEKQRLTGSPRVLPLTHETPKEWPASFYHFLSLPSENLVRPSSRALGIIIMIVVYERVMTQFIEDVLWLLSPALRLTFGDGLALSAPKHVTPAAPTMFSLCIKKCMSICLPPEIDCVTRL